MYAAKIVENLYLAADETSEGTVLPEFEAVRDSEQKIINANLKCVNVAGKMFVQYKNLLSP